MSIIDNADMTDTLITTTISSDTDSTAAYYYHY